MRKRSLVPAVEDKGSAGIVDNGPPVELTNKTFWQRASPVIACGSGLFSDGYLNGVSILHVRAQAQKQKADYALVRPV